jgi:RecJ-like exonuclease
MQRLLKKAARVLKTHCEESVKLISHMDADGIAAASILSTTLDREGIAHTVNCMKLDQLSDIASESLIILSDLGSGQLNQLLPLSGPMIILDHHPPLPMEQENLIHINPSFFGHDGSSEISGAGIAYLFARAVNPENRDLSSLAIVGACGDMQNFGKLSGMNRDILRDGEKAGVIHHEDDLLLYGRYTRPLFKSLQYFSDPYIPGISGNEQACKQLLQELGIESDDNTWVTLSMLSFDQKRRLASELIRRSLQGVPPQLGTHVPQTIIGETYTLLQEEDNSPLRDSSEFATCLNACGRRNRFEVGIEVAKGNRGIYYDMMISLLQEHRAAIAQAIESLSQDSIKRIERLQIMDASGVSDIIVGTVAQMLLGQNGIHPYLPLLLYTPSEKNEDVYKISVRCSRLLRYQNIHLGKAIRKAAHHVQGEGGGHAPACGAYIPQEHLERFIDHFAGLISHQFH